MIASGREVQESGGVEPPSTTELGLLEAEELRLLAAAIGDHLRIELAERVEALRQQRRALELLWGGL